MKLQSWSLSCNKAALDSWFYFFKRPKNGIKLKMNNCSCKGPCAKFGLSHCNLNSSSHISSSRLAACLWKGVFALHYSIYSPELEMEWNFNVELPISFKAKFKPLIKLIT